MSVEPQPNQVACTESEQDLSVNLLSRVASMSSSSDDEMFAAMDKNYKMTAVNSRSVALQPRIGPDFAMPNFSNEVKDIIKSGFLKFDTEAFINEATRHLLNQIPYPRSSEYMIYATALANTYPDAINVPSAKSTSGLVCHSLCIISKLLLLDFMSLNYVWSIFICSFLF